MKRSDYIKAVAQKGDFTQVSVKAVLEAMEEVVQETLPTEDVTVFKGLTLTTKTYEPRIGVNPQTQEKISIPASRKPKAKFGSRLKEAVKL